MKTYLIAAGIALAALAATGSVAFAQTTTNSNQVMVTNTPSTNSVTPGTSGQAFGTITLTGNGVGSFAVSSIPVTVSSNTGASVNSLSNCQLTNSSGTPLTTGANVLNPANGSNTFTFNTPLMVQAGSSMVLNIQCNVSSAAPAGSTFQFQAGNPVFATGLGATLSPAPSIAPGQQNAVLGYITLDGTRSGGNVNVSSIPVTLSFNGGASASDFTNCSLRSTTNMATALNTGNNAISSTNTSGSVTAINLDAPFSVPSGATEEMALVCNVAPGTPSGSSATITIDPSTISSANLATGAAIVPTTATATNGSAGPVTATVLVAAPTTPGAPNTGLGGNAPQNILTLMGAALVAMLGSIYLIRSKRAA